MNQTNFKQLDKEITSKNTFFSPLLFSSFFLILIIFFLDLLDDDYFFTRKIQLKTRNASGIG